MSHHIIETVLFTLEPSVQKEAFIQSIEGSTIFIQSCSGFIARRLSCDEQGQWIEHVEWKSMEDAKNAAKRIVSDHNVQNFMKCIHGPSVTVHHTQLHTSIN